MAGIRQLLAHNTLFKQSRRLRSRINRPSANTTYNANFFRWFNGDIDPHDSTGEFACQRLRADYFNPGIKPGFTINQTDKIYTVGSCFARGIENALKGRGMTVESAATDFDKFPRISKDVTPLGFTNKYNTFSILNEFEWALDPDKQYSRDCLIKLDNGLYIDPHVNPTLVLADLEETLERRSLITEVTKRITKCKVVVITLGLVEVWKDEVNEKFINITPTKEMRDLHPGRFTHHKVGFQKNLDNLNAVYKLLMKYCLEDLQIVVTVSPIPLMATFTDSDIVIANTYSKSTLRTVAQEWSDAHSNIHYFPSYEIVMNSNRSVAWADDLRHASGNIVQFIMDFFIKSYVNPPKD